MSLRPAIAVLAALGLGAGCGGQAPRPAQQEDVAAALRQRGISLQARDSASSGVLGVTPAVYRTAGGELEVFRFSSSRAARTAAARVRPDGYTIVTDGKSLAVDWAEPPHWFRSGDEVVLYLGTSPRLLEALDAIAGPQFAGA